MEKELQRLAIFRTQVQLCIRLPLIALGEWLFGNENGFGVYEQPGILKYTGIYQITKQHRLSLSRKCSQWLL